MYAGFTSSNHTGFTECLQYRYLVERSEVAPILLFNEADAILGKRMEGAERAVDRMENSIQNIILQEIENMEGILIATTNGENGASPPT
ncbi:AAA family ATPase [Bacteroides caecigallinarum]|nr:AAA family ATPase [Bacteroides caecigallinarum]